MSVFLRPYQKDVLEELHSGSILCGGTGVGKSLTALAYYHTKVCNGKILENGTVTRASSKVPLYIITTAMKRDKHEWEDECSKVFVEPITVDSWNNLKKYSDVTGAFFIFDEQKVGGTGKWAKLFIKVARANTWILLSATPGDTWMHYATVFVANGFFKNHTDFNRRHVVYNPYITKYPSIKGYADEKLLREYRSRILVNMETIRETVRVQIPIIVDYDHELFRRVFDDKWDVYKNQPIQNSGVGCYVLRKVVNSDPSRLKAVQDIVDKRHKAIIFYNYDYELEMLLTLKGVTIAQWSGHWHDNVPDTDNWVYLVQYTAGAEGWNCISTDTVIFYSQSYSYRAMEQAAGRIDRLNTPFKELYYYTLKSLSKIDKMVSASLKVKKDFNDRALASHFENRKKNTR